MTEGNKAAAEDYRRQRQSAAAGQSGFDYDAASVDEWLARNERLLRTIIRANGTPEKDVEQLLGEYKARLAATSPGSEYDDKNVRAILQPILMDIENLCRENRDSDSRRCRLWRRA